MVWKFLYKYVKQAKYITIGLFFMLIVETVLARYQNYLMANMIGALGLESKADIVLVLSKYLMLFVAAVLFLSFSDAIFWRQNFCRLFIHVPQEICFQKFTNTPCVFLKKKCQAIFRERFQTF